MNAFIAALRMHRLNTMRDRSADAQRKRKKESCTCPACQGLNPQHAGGMPLAVLIRSLTGATEPEDTPAPSTGAKH